MHATYISTLRPLVYGAYPLRETAVIDLGPILMPPHKEILFDSGIQIWNHGWITYADRLPFDRLDHVSFYPLDIDELADFVLWLALDHNPDWFIAKCRKLSLDNLRQTLEIQRIPTAWALRRVLARPETEVP